MGNTFCPIMTAGQLANQFSDGEKRIDCEYEQCGLWDKERVACGLKQKGEKK